MRKHNARSAKASTRIGKLRARFKHWYIESSVKQLAAFGRRMHEPVRAS